MKSQIDSMQKLIEKAKEVSHEGDEQFIKDIIANIKDAIANDDDIALANIELQVLNFVNKKGWEGVN